MSELTLTPGSRRKLLRHIEEVSGVNELAKLMQIRVALLRKIILADDELKEACLESGILSPAGFVLPGVEQQWVPIGMNPSFVKKVWAKRRKEEQLRKLIEKETKAEKVTAAFKAITVRNNEPPKPLISTSGETIVLNSKPTVRDIIERVIAGTEFTYEDIIGKRRTKDLVPFRHRAMADCVAIRTDLSLPTIGRLFGGRDHTTVLHAARKMGVTDRSATAEGRQSVSSKVGINSYPIQSVDNSARAA